MISNMGFILPEQNDFYDIENFNENFRLTENKIVDLNNGVTAANATINAKYSELRDIISQVENKDTAVIQSLLSSINNITFRFEGLCSILSVSALGIPHGVSNSNSDNIAKTVSMPGLLPDANVPNGLVIGVRFANGHNAVQEQVTLNINAGGSVGYIGGKTLWNEKGRIGTVGNVEVLQDSTRFQIFRWDASVNRFIWITAVSP